MSASSQSPCINICQMDEASGWCKGCLRSIEEIAGWSQLSEQQRKAVLLLLPQRRVLRRQRSAPSSPDFGPPDA